MNIIREDWRRKDGFTLVELSAASAILIIAITMALGGFTYALKAAHQGDIQDELDVEVQKAMESLKKNLRLSSLNKMVYYPAGSGPYTGISFPMARDDDGDGAIETNSTGKIDWDQTLVYHVWLSDPDELRLTTFDPRDNSLTEGERQAQLESVVSNGNSSAADNGTNGTTRSIFENVFTWSIAPQGSTYNAYDDDESRDAGILLGTKVLSGGDHTFKFTIEGKDSSSSGYKVGLDTLFMTPAGDYYEAEGLLPVTTESGSTAASEYKAGGSWSGNFQLLFPATATGQTFTLTIPNDAWEETNFRSTGESHDKTTVEFDTSLNPDDYVVKLDGNDTSWRATEQSGDQDGSSIGGNALAGFCIRVVLRGGEMESGNWFGYEGAKVKVKFKTGSAVDGGMIIDAAYIAECVDSNSPAQEIVVATSTDLLTGGSVSIAGGDSEWSGDPVAFEIDRNKSYAISFAVRSAPPWGNGWAWFETNNPAIIGTFAINDPAHLPAGAGHCMASDWDIWPGTNSYIATNEIVCVEEVFVTYPTNGIFTSAIFDTILDDPAYDESDWDITMPGGTKATLRVRAGDQPDMSDADDWTIVTEYNMASAPADISSTAAGRYVQFQTILEPDSTYTLTPAVEGVEIEWTGEDRIANIGGTFTQGPDYGIFKLEIDGEEMVSGLRVNLEIYEDTYGYGGTRRITSALTSEIQPRNTGK